MFQSVVEIIVAELVIFSPVITTVTGMAIANWLNERDDRKQHSCTVLRRAGRK